MLSAASAAVIATLTKASREKDLPGLAIPPLPPGSSENASSARPKPYADEVKPGSLYEPGVGAGETALFDRMRYQPGAKESIAEDDEDQGQHARGSLTRDDGHQPLGGGEREEHKAGVERRARDLEVLVRERRDQRDEDRSHVEEPDYDVT